MHRFTKYIRVLSFRLVHKFERIIGVDFYGGVSEESLRNPHLVHPFGTSGGEYLINVLRDLRISRNDCILDIGCGSGTAMRAFLKFPFTMIHGIEIDRNLALKATANFRKLWASRVRVFCGDAVSFGSYANYNIFYLYNPFPGIILSQVLKQINISSKTDREVVIIYTNPKSHSEVEMAGFTKLREYPDEWGNGIFVYSNTPRNSRLN
jgi:SAM-dependent methyltransferase